MISWFEYSDDEATLFRIKHVRVNRIENGTNMKFYEVVVLVALYLTAWTTNANAASCMPNMQGKAQLCYHKGRDGHCTVYGPTCQVHGKQGNILKAIKHDLAKPDMPK